MSVGPIEDLLAIRELVETFNVGIMRRDLDTWGNTWAEEGFWQIPLREEPAEGRHNIVAVLASIMEHNEFVSITAFPNATVVEGDSAHGKVYVQEFIFPREGKQRILAGYFDDKYVKRDGRWHFLSRIYTRMWRSTIPAE